MYRTQLPSRALAAIVLTALVAGCSGGGSSPQPVQSTPTPPSGNGSGTGSGGGSGSTGATSGSAFTCPSSDADSSSARGAFVPSKSDTVHRAVARSAAPSAAAATGLIGVTYASALSASAKTLAVSRETASSASLVREMTFARTGRYERILHVTPGTEAQAIAKLRTQTGVVAASMTGTRRSTQTVAAQYYSNDPYYNGFTEAQILSGGDTGGATYHVDPYEENSSVPGQWGDHAVRLPYAQAYAQSGNGSGVVNGGALGSSSVKIAVIDSGEDTTHPELASKIVYQRCYITGSTGQSTSDYTVDEDGHGTDVSGIAAAASNNGIGFVGTGGSASIYGYRVFPTPDDNCTPGNTKGANDNQCGASTIDITDAIMDAVNQNVSVINLSLGGGGCTNGVDEDSTEGNAVASAIAANIVVVAASGNGGTGTVSAPGCDSGVIAVGATALSDGTATGTSSAPAGSASNPVEYVAGYSQYGSPAAAVNSASAWGIVAPGGDPSDADDSPTATTTDDLHWIENIWTSTPYMASSTDTSFEGECDPDFGSAGGTTDCRTLIAGTSQATPLVAGAAALIIAANPAYASPAKMKQLLCSTAHDIGSAYEGCGRLDLYRAMAVAVGDANPPASQ